MRARRQSEKLAALQRAAIPLVGGSEDYTPLLERIGEARYVLIGEASHGTHEFYEERAWITRRLIEEKGFGAVAVEADWPDAYRVNRYVRGTGDDPDAGAALGDFRRFPLWMWRNRVVLAFIDWLHRHNAGRDRGDRAGFYGLDLYSLHASIQAVVAYLDRVDPEAARRARARYACFEHFDQDPQAYGLAAGYGLAESCEDEVVAQLVELQRRAAEYTRLDGRVPEDEHFAAEQNARLARNAEQYYRAMYCGRVSLWNLRDRHMAETLDELVEHLDRTTGRTTRAVLWAHNSHLGDARATEMGAGGEWNVGQLVRQQHGRDAFLVGQTTYDGEVTAADDWDAPARLKQVRPALPGSVEALFHELPHGRFLLPLRDGGAAVEALSEPLLERAIGVIYRTQTERQSHYFHVRLSDQFDAVIHLDRTGAVEPLDPISVRETAELPETFPTGV